MAFPNRVGNLLKQNVIKNVSSVSSASSPSLFQALRCRSLSAATKLIFEDFPFTTEEGSLREEFAQYGSVLEVRLHNIMDHETDMMKSFGSVTYDTTEAASIAIKAFDGRYFKGIYPRVYFASEKPLSGIGYGGGGGYGGGSGGYGVQGGGYSCGGNQGGGNYSNGDGNCGGDSSYGGGNQFPGGGGNDGYDDSLQGGGGNYSGNKPAFASLLNNDRSDDVGGGNYFGNKPNFASILNNGTSGTVGGNQQPLGDDQVELEVIVFDRTSMRARMREGI